MGSLSREALGEISNNLASSAHSDLTRQDSVRELLAHMLGKEIKCSLPRQVSRGFIKTGSMITVEPVIRVVSEEPTLRVGITNQVDITHRYVRIEFSKMELERYIWRLLELGRNTPSIICLLYTSPSPRDATLSRMPSSA